MSLGLWIGKGLFAPLPLATGCTTCPPPCDSCRDLDKGQYRELSSCMSVQRIKPELGCDWKFKFKILYL